jgi:hypothetical protein
VAASECVNPTAAFDAVGHRFGRRFDVVDLCFFDARHYVTRVIKPLFRKHILVKQ